jgi:Carboxypeptidase regulatory-like domain
MKRLLFIPIFLALAIGANAQQPAQAPQEKPAAQTPAAQQPATQQKAQRPARTSSRSRSITGRVIDEGNSPLEDAAIVSFPAGLLNSTQSAATVAKIRPTSADEQGKFALENLTPGAYLVFAEVPGYVVAPDLDNNPEQKYYRPGDSMTIRMIKGGVITGAVTTSLGEPVVGARVNPVRLRDLKGRAAHQTATDLQREWKTDDRGVYRIYGLEPGVYLLSTGGKGFIQLIPEGYDADAPTYYPSSTRDNATEVTVHSGEELTGIDIRYRDNSRGYAVSGSVSGATAASSMVLVTVILNDAVTEAFTGMVMTPMAPGMHSFAFDGVADGEYIVSAVASDYGSGSPPRKVSVKGADVTGLELAIAPYGSIEGRIAVEQALGAERKADCQNKSSSSIEEVLILARLDSKSKEQGPTGKAFSLFPFPVDSTPNNKGEFKVPRLEAARHHIEARMPSEDWYVRSMSLPPDPPSTQPRDAARNGIAVKTGERIAGMNITLAEGAAGVRGRVLSATEGVRLPALLRLHLIPAEKESAEDTLRFMEVAVQSDGTFALTNLAPGKYWVLARPSADEALLTSNPPRPVAWDGDGRKQLRKEGEAATVSIELQPCQRLTDYVLRYKKQ